MSNDRSEAEKNNTELLKFQLNLYLDQYKEHLEIFVKAMLLYLAVTGAVAGYMFGEHIDRPTKIALVIFSLCCSVFGVTGSLNARKWTYDIERKVGIITESLGLQSFLFTAAKLLTLFQALLSALILIAGIVNIIILSSRG